MKDGVRKPSGNRVSFNAQPNVKGLRKNSSFSCFAKSNLGKNFSKGKKKGK
ncbi:hypothetical protein RAC47_03065 [Borreliella carolinensis]|uniref:Uncharacterized protein n=1 Tax=Borrelia bissettiae (strain DSM 17990 / CIP 109136 / DN127) TaxID=521010 RepID=G0AM55_BORBD|nr:MULTISPECIES: hypothetical protein [Borreliella]AEL18781.1 conserved hypothetical protein [Borreliella bissettiae DN127]WKD00024.1 hypothetical protein QIA02_03070 [Borreliella bissettiae]WNY60380.1 hypothetical protein QIA03_02665 [Borreliella bissettiae]WNY63056.1 hypothetical protein RAC47_03065 [Borreliella carolinensis]